MTSLIRTSRPLFRSLSSLLPTYAEDDFFAPFLLRRGAESTPALNIEEKADMYKLCLALPGVQKRDIQLAVEDDVLRISCAQKEEKTRQEEDGYLHKEFHYGNFERSVTLPREGVQISDIKANHKEGVLTITIPKRKVAERKNVIPVG